MANTYTQIHIQTIFAVQNRQSLIQRESSEWINKKGFTKSRFSWQGGYGAFSYAKSLVPKVIRYIQNQEEHHKIMFDL